MAKYQSEFDRRFGKQGSGASLAQRNADNAAFARAKDVLKNRRKTDLAAKRAGHNAEVRAAKEYKDLQDDRYNPAHPRHRELMLPNLDHLSKENKIPANVSNVPAGGKGSFDTGETFAKVDLPSRATLEKIGGKGEPLSAKELDAKVNREMAAEDARAAKRDAKTAQEVEAHGVKGMDSALGGDFESKHPRKPSGSAAGGEFRRK